MRYILIVPIARSLFLTAVWFVKACYQVGLMLGSSLVWLLKPKKKIPAVDPSKDANSVKPLGDE
jgi:hypothetical protein